MKRDSVDQTGDYTPTKSILSANYGSALRKSFGEDFVYLVIYRIIKTRQSFKIKKGPKKYDLLEQIH
jgi:hypothetical protein